MSTQTVGLRLQRINIDLLAGEPIDFTVPALDALDQEVDVTSWTALAQVRPHAGGTLLHTFTLAASADGFRVTADPADTLTWAQWRCPLARWDLWVTPPAENTRPLACGRVFVRSPVSAT